jgi:hypothetical protein
LLTLLLFVLTGEDWESHFEARKLQASYAVNVPKTPRKAPRRRFVDFLIDRRLAERVVLEWQNGGAGLGFSDWTLFP